MTTAGLVAAHRKGDICKDAANKRGECNRWSLRELHRDEDFCFQQSNELQSRKTVATLERDGHIKLFVPRVQGVLSSELIKLSEMPLHGRHPVREGH